MFTAENYQLIDFGDGRRLERFGPLLLDRPCPVAESAGRSDPAMWQGADARFERTGGNQGRWTCAGELPKHWTITHGPIRLELKRTEFGHLGVFPEQAANWDWLAAQIRRVRATHRPAPRPDPPLKVLNLFAYTGGSTLAAAAAGAEVVHVDAARNIVARARRNAELSGLHEAPIRWIVEDARKFVRRELQRGSRYDAVILDPPSYGHGRRGEVWRLSNHLPRLLAICARLTAGRRRFMLLTCHTPKYTPERLEAIMRDTLGDSDEGAGSGVGLTIRATDGRHLPSGAAVRWAASADV